MNIPLAKLIPWKGSKAQLMWAIQSLMPIHYNKLRRDLSRVFSS